MRLMDALILRVRSLFHGSRVERELDDELRFHVEEHVRELVEQGMPPADARTAALRAFGGVERIKESVRDTWHVRLLRDLAQDLRYAARSLRHAPTFTVVAALTIALGVGATVAIFSVVDGVLLKPLNYPDSHRIVQVLTHWTKTGHNGSNLAGGDLVEVRDQAGVFEAFSTFYGDETAVVPCFRPVGRRLNNSMRVRIIERFEEYAIDDAENRDGHTCTPNAMVSAATTVNVGACARLRAAYRNPARDHGAA